MAGLPLLVEQLEEHWDCEISCFSNPKCLSV